MLPIRFRLQARAKGVTMGKGASFSLPSARLRPRRLPSLVMK